nr:MAG TPA: hypothetical protein [Caudoviricetes sp.]
MEPDRGLCGYHKPNRAGETSLKENAKSNRGDLLMGHPYFLAGYLVFVVHVFSPITHASRLLMYLVFSLTTFLKAKKRRSTWCRRPS